MLRNMDLTHYWRHALYEYHFMASSSRVSLLTLILLDYRLQTSLIRTGCFTKRNGSVMLNRPSYALSACNRRVSYADLSILK